MNKRGGPRKAPVDCSEIGCFSQARAKGLCKRHYHIWHRRDKKAQGLCIMCGKRPIDLAYRSFCEECARKRRIDQRMYA